jgi:transcriptional regulator with XRE-family HTH domain
MKQRRAEANAETAGGNELDSLGLRLQNVRLLQNTTQSKLAKLLGISQTALSHMERRDDILLSTLNAYVEALARLIHDVGGYGVADVA